MEPIHVLAPPKQAFNKHRRISDLIRAQINHLKHLENKLPEEHRREIPQHNIVTENEAALYIAAMTRILRSQPVVAASPAITPIDRGRRPNLVHQEKGLSLAAAAESEEIISASKIKDSHVSKIPSTKPKVVTPPHKGKK